MMTKFYVYSRNLLDQTKSIFVSKLKNRSGMEMLQMIIIVGIAVALGAGAYALFNEQLSTFGSNLRTKMSTMFTDMSNN